MSGDIERVIAAVEKFHAEGQRSLRQYPGRLAFGGSLTTSEKQKLRLQRRFADPGTGYTAEGLREMIAQFRKHDHALPPTAIGKLMGVPPGPKRDKMVADAIKGQWSLPDVERHLKLSGLTVPRTQGRAVEPPESLKDALEKLEADYCPSWLRLVESIQNNPAVKIPGSLSRKVQVVRDAVTDLLEAAKRMRGGMP